MRDEATMEKDTLLSRVSARYERIEAALAALTPQQWLAPTTPDAWSVKDMLAHITTWLDRLVEVTDAALRGAEPAHAAVGLSDAEVDAVNAAVCCGASR